MAECEREKCGAFMKENVIIKERLNMADCSKTETFLREWWRMCDYMNGDCDRCIFYGICNEGYVSVVREHVFTEGIIKDIQNWSDYHPQKEGDANG